MNNNGYNIGGYNPWWRITNNDFVKYANKNNIKNKNICHHFLKTRLTPYEITTQISERVLTNYFQELLAPRVQAGGEDLNILSYEFKIFNDSIINYPWRAGKLETKNIYHYILQNKLTNEIVAYYSSDFRCATPIPVSSKFNSNNELGWLPVNHPERIIFWMEEPSEKHPYFIDYV